MSRYRAYWYKEKDTYWTILRPIFKVIMLLWSIVGDTLSKAHNCSRKHANFDIDQGRVSPIFWNVKLKKCYQGSKLNYAQCPFLLWCDAFTQVSSRLAISWGWEKSKSVVREEFTNESNCKRMNITFQDFASERTDVNV